MEAGSQPECWLGNRMDALGLKIDLLTVKQYKMTLALEVKSAGT